METLGELFVRRAELSNDFFLSEGDLNVGRAHPYAYDELLEPAVAVGEDIRGSSSVPTRQAVVAVLGAPGALWYSVFAALQVANVVVAPISPALSPREVKEMVDSLRPDAVCFCPGVRSEIRESLDGFRTVSLDGLDELHKLVHVVSLIGSDAQRAVPPAGTAVVLHTSGTTGKPKAVLQSHRNYLGLCARWAPEALLRSDRVISFLSPTHQAGLLLSFLAPVFMEGFLAQMFRFEADLFWSMSNKLGCYAGVLISPAPQRLLDETPEGVENLTFRRAFGGSTPAPLRRQMYDRFGIMYTHEQIGSTETTLFAFSGSHQRRAQQSFGDLAGPRGGVLVGRVIPGWTEVRVVASSTDIEVGPLEVGEIQVRGNGVFPGYLGRKDLTSQAFTADGFYRTGDHGYLDPEGYVYWVGRSTHVIRRSGENISPAEIERVLIELDGVSSVVVMGVPDRIRDEEILVIIESDETLDYESVITACKAELAAYKVPRYWARTSQLPRNEAGKVLVRELRKDWRSFLELDRRREQA